MLIRGAAGRKMPYGRVVTSDTLYFINNNGEGVIRAHGKVTAVLNSEKMDRETSTALVDKHSAQLQLSKQQYQRWAGKRYLVLISVGNIAEVPPFEIDRTAYGNMDDWLPVEDIETVKIA